MTGRVLVVLCAIILLSSALAEDEDGRYAPEQYKPVLLSPQDMVGYVLVSQEKDEFPAYDEKGKRHRKDGVVEQEWAIADGEEPVLGMLTAKFADPEEARTIARNTAKSLRMVKSDPPVLDAGQECRTTDVRGNMEALFHRGSFIVWLSCSKRNVPKGDANAVLQEFAKASDDKIARHIRDAGKSE
jgi:hypothetical protein